MQTNSGASDPDPEPDPDPNEGESEIDEDEQEDALIAAKIATKHTLPDVELQAATWKEGEPIPYLALAHVFSLVEATTKRLEITAILTAFFLLVIQRRKPGDAESFKQIVYLCINRVGVVSIWPDSVLMFIFQLCPDFVGVELGIGESLLVKAIAESTGRKAKEVQNELKKEGDLGLVAMVGSMAYVSTRWDDIVYLARIRKTRKSYCSNRDRSLRRMCSPSLRRSPSPRVTR